MIRDSPVLKGVALGYAALLVLAPITRADDPPPGQCDPAADPTCQQQQQNQGVGVASQVLDAVKQGVNLATKPVQGPGKTVFGTPAVGLLVALDGIPTCVPFGVGVMGRQDVVPNGPIDGRC